MNYRNIVAGLVACSLCFGMASCKKNENVTTNEQSAALEQKKDVNFEKDAVNGLLEFVPADTPYVYASTREFRMDSPAIQKILKYSAAITEKSQTITALAEKEMSADPHELAQLKNAMKLLDSVAPLIQDFPKNAANYGLNAQMADSVMYVVDDCLVVKATIDDRAKFAEKFDPIIESLCTILSASPESKIQRAVVEGNNFRSIYSVSMTDDSDDEANEAGTAQSSVVSKYYVDYGVNAITLIMPFDVNKAVDFDQFLKPAANPLKKEALGKIDSSINGIGYIDNVAIVDKIMGTPAEVVASLFDVELDAACGSEFKEIVKDYPRTKLVQKIVGDDHFTMEATVVVSDKEWLKKLQSLSAPHIALGTGNDLFELGFNLDIGKTVDLLMAMSKNMATKEYKCALLNDVKESVTEIDALLASPEAMLYKDSIFKLTGLNMALSKLDLSKMPEVAVEAIVGLRGTSVAGVMTLLKPLVVRAVPELASLKANAESVTSIDLSEMIPNESAQAYLTDTDLLVGTKSYDLIAISKKEAKDNKKIFTFSMSGELIKSGLDMAANDEFEDESAKESKELLDVMGGILSGYRVTSNMGINEEGLSFDIDYTIK